MNANTQCQRRLASLPFLATTLLLLLLTFGADTWAKPPIRAAFFSVYPSAVSSTLDNLPSKAGHCGVCHYDFNGGGTRNPYGIAVGNNGSNSNAVWIIRVLDPDGDGFITHTEITNTSSYHNTPTFPGLQSSNVNLVVNIPVAEVLPYITPTAATDTTPPVVQVLTPNGGQVWTANRATNITWTATDASGIAAVKIYVSLNNGVSYQTIARDLANTGTFSWTPADRPTTQARIKVVATDNYANTTNDVSDAVFTIASPAFTNVHGVASTLRDFDLPGTQPFEHGGDLEASSTCAACHGGYNASVEPQSGWQGSMMSHASRDPLFRANLVIANQDAANSGDLCLRCHLPRGWLAGRSVPTDGSRMEAADGDGVSCALCHRMVDPVYQSGVSPTNDLPLLAALSFPGTEYGNGMFVIDPTGTRRGPFSNAAAPHSFLASAFHRQAAFCGTCHDVSNPAFQNDGAGHYVANAMNTTATNFSPHFMAPVERTYSEWRHSEYNTPGGVYAPQFAGKKAGGRVATCQDCHMRDVSGYGCNTNGNAGVPWRDDLPLHDLTGGSTWLPGLLTNLFPTEVNAAAIQAGIARAQQLLTNAASLAVADAAGQLRVTVTNECGHKLPTGYPEGRRVWLNVKFYNDAMDLLGESGAYNPNNGVLTRDVEAKIYEVHPGLETNLATALGLEPGPSLHFVLNNRTYEDNRIPPRGFTNASYAAFGGSPVGHSYADGQYWDDTLYGRPPGTTKAIVQLYYQSTSKEFIEFLRDENRTDTQGQVLYELWRTNGMCPPTLLCEVVWQPIFELTRVAFTPQGKLQTHFRARPGVTYTVEYTDNLNGSPVWSGFTQNGSFTATNTVGVFEDDFTTNTSGSPSATGRRFYRFRYNGIP